MQDTDLSAAPARSTSLAAWLRLERTAGIGPRAAAALLAAFGSPDAIFSADFSSLSTHVAPAQARALLQPPSEATLRLLDATLDWLARPGHYVVALGEPGYPDLLARITDPPLLLYIRGLPHLLDGPSLAIVGSRNASAQGRANAQAFAESLSGAGLCIVSGLALGIDAAAHEGALRRCGGTVAVVGTGADIIYPTRNRALCERIAQEGCIVSEYPVGTPPLPGNFPKRNRIISGLAAGVLVVEAALQSGSLITARQAAEQGRDVFAIPGSIHAALAKGCHMLIREGAKLVDTARDVLEALALSPLLAQQAARLPAADIPLTDIKIDNSAARHTSAPADAALLDALGHDPVESDILLERLGCSPGELAARLLVLELSGHLERLPGGLIQRIWKG
ncbi:DNA protecting protein DprA [Massilia sp. PDC64]|nr:DNA-processing protein DprA [Massilia sp. PDC64]SDF56784.1 DNA protecting protein DprA [Massilia sp. PDC64]